MLDFIFDIYKYGQLISACKEVIELCYEYEHIKVQKAWEGIQDLLPEFCQTLAGENLALANEIMNCAVEACACTTQQVPNYNLMGDRLSDCIPLMYEGMKYMADIDVTEGKYRLVSSRSGLLSLENLESKYVYNSLSDPLWEGHQKARSLYSSTITHFHIAGCDLGYFAWELFALSDMSLDIYIYHSDEKVIEYAMDYGLLSWIPQDKLHIFTGSPEEVAERISHLDFADVHMGFVQLRDFRDSVTPDIFNELMVASIPAAARKNYAEYSAVNIWRNLKNAPKTIYELPIKKDNKDWMVIVAGPSLDDNIEFIKANKDKYKTIAATTIYKKLLDCGIVPDFLIVCDPQPRTYGHMENIECHKPVLLLASTAHWKFAEYYEGDKYLIPCASSLESMLYFESHRIKTVSFAGTVAYGAVQMAIFMGAKKVHLFGLDLAYPGLRSHASGTMDNKEMDDKDMVTVPSVSGDGVKTSLQFKFYIDNMEELFLANRDVEFFNHSQIGAAFRGTQKF